MCIIRTKTDTFSCDKCRQTMSRSEAEEIDLATLRHDPSEFIGLPPGWLDTPTHLLCPDCVNDRREQARDDFERWG